MHTITTANTNSRENANFKQIWRKKMNPKNFRKIPDRIINLVNQILGNNLIVSCLKQYSADDIRNGTLAHLGISLTGNGLSFPATIIPDESQGKHSYINTHGRVIIRRDLPKITKYRSMVVPNWGDYSKGEHTINMPYRCYVREFSPPHLIGINISCINTSANQATYGILFELDEVLDKTSADFTERLFELINILQENINYCDVNSSNLQYEDYITSTQLAWEILPPGEREAFISRFSSARSSRSQIAEISQRADFLMSLNPRGLIYGRSGLQRYMGAQFSDNLVVFENTRYGNAIYIMYDNWEELSRRSRTELLTGRFGESFDRIPHNTGWEEKVRDIVQRKLFPKRA
jgi:hypothetical protein